MDENVMNALQSRAVYLPGGYDRDGRILIVINMINDLQSWNRKCLEICINYIKKSLSTINDLKKGFTVIFDAQKYSCRLTKSQCKNILSLFDCNCIENVLLIRSEGFWEKHVDNCTKSRGKGEPLIISKSRLQKYFELSELPEELGGTLNYKHEIWLQNRMNIEEFKVKFDKVINDLEDFHVLLLDHKSIRPSEIDETLNICTQLYNDIQMTIKNIIEMGSQLMLNIKNSYRYQKQILMKIPQDLVFEENQIEKMLNDIEKKQTLIKLAWNDLEKTIDDIHELSNLEDGITFVINWILNTGEILINHQLNIGYDVHTCEELRHEHELLEMQCSETYAIYSELLYKIDSYTKNRETFAFKDLLSQKDFMDFICRSFAIRLERRRNLLITSVRFYRLVSDYFDRTNEVFESLIMGTKIEDYDLATSKLQKLKDCQQTLETIEKELIKEGEKLSDMLSMPVKDALGRDLDLDYSDDIANIHDILDATIARRNIFIDSVELQKLTLEQITHICTYENDTKMAIRWLDDLYNVMIKCHSHVGSNVHEIQVQKDDLQTFQETGKSIHNYGCQLLEASLVLRQSCKLDTEVNIRMNKLLKNTWYNLQTISQEQMTRLRVTAVFHRSVEEYCIKLNDLKNAVLATGEIEDLERRRTRIRKYLALRERLLVEVGRMVRLGRLLKTRLKEPFILDDKFKISSDTNENENRSTETEIPCNESIVINPANDNVSACDAITNKLTDVTNVAESLDSALRETQSGLDLVEMNSNSSEKKFENVQTGSDEWNSSTKSTEDESFITASDYNCATSQSQSSSFQTASECHTSPLQSFDKSSPLDDIDEFDTNANSELLTNNAAVGLSSVNVSFDSSDHQSFLSAQDSVQSNDERFSNLDTSTDTISNNYTKPKSPNAFHIKVVEVEPKLTALGENIDEAVCFQKQHDDILKQLQGMPTPVEEFIRKADKLLASKKVDTHVLDAMGHTLNVIWDDILKLLHDRKHLLDLCANFHEKMGSCRGKMASLEVACKDTMIPIEVEAVQEFLSKFKQLRIDVLTTVMSALKEGNELLAQLQEIAKSGTLDSRPGHIKRDATRAVNQVQQWLENLHDRRNLLESAWQTRKGQLEQCLALAILAKDLNELENTLMNQKNSISGVFSLGECEHTANLSLQEYNGLKHDALLLRDRALKITRATEKLVSGGIFQGDESCSRAYGVLSNCTEYLELVDQRVHWLQQAREFFTKAEKALSVFEKLETELASVKTPANTPEAFEYFSKVLKDVKVFADESLRLGYALLDEVGRTKPETQGIKRVLDEIENRRIYIESICSSNTEAQVKVTEALNKFLEEYNQLLSWLVSIAEAFLKTNNTMGTNLGQARNFLHIHHQLMQDLEVKGENINNLLMSIKNFLPSLNAQQRYDVDSKAESLHKHWIELKELVLKRVDIAALHVEFLEKAQNLNNTFEQMEILLNESPHENKLKILEDNWNEIKNSYGNLKAIGLRFLNMKVADPYLETKSACSSVEEILKSFSNRQIDITSSWKNWTTSVTQKQEIEIILEKIMTENLETLNQTTKLDTKLYPVFISKSEDPLTLKSEVTEKLRDVTEDIEKAQNEVVKRIETTTKIQTKDNDLTRKLEDVINNLKLLKTKLDNIKQDYRILLEDILHFLNNIHDLRKTIDDYYHEQQHINDSMIIENHMNRDYILQILSKHDQFYESTMNKFRTLISHSEKLIERIRIFEPDNIKEYDTDRILKLLENLRIQFEMKNNDKTIQLKNLQNKINFHNDLFEIHKNLDNVHKQLNEINEQNLETLTSSKTASLAFEYYERTIELLEKRIENFIKSTENISPEELLKSNVPDELNKLKNKWENFRDQVKLTRKRLNSITDYFELLEQINSKFRETSVFYADITNKIPFLRNSVEASNLVNDIEKYVSTNENPQMAKIENLLNISNGIKDGEKRAMTAKLDNIEIFQSFGKLKSDIGMIDERLRNDEKQEEQKIIQGQEKEAEEILKKTVVNEVFTEIKYIRPQFTQHLQDTVIKEGEKFIFRCRVIGDPIPAVEWFKDGISIQNNPDYHTSYSNGECTLSIDETFTADSARFMCMASNLVGADETSATLTVKEHSIDEQMTPPKILKYLQSGTAREGSSFQFCCIATGNPLPTVQWFKDNNCIDDSPDYVILYNNGEAILRFDEVFLEDHAVYTCKFSNPCGFEQCSAKLNVEPLEPTEIPSFKLPLSNVMARVGQKIKLECIVAGIPKPEIFWTHNGKPFTGRDIKYENDRVTLIIQEAYPKDAGLYVVTARNLAGEAYSSCNVSVKGRLPNETSDSEIASDMEPIKPTVQLPLKDISVFEGKSIRLDCVIVGQPEPEVIWYHNDRPVKESSDIQLLFQGDRCSLIIQEAYLEDAGSYRVVAINSAGEASSNCALTVTPLNIAEPATRQPSEKSISIESPPKFEKFLTDVLVAEGDTVELECKVSGNGPFTAKWYLSNRELTETDRLKLISEANGVFKLIINKVTSDDKGVYTVKVSNKSGDAKCFSHLIVKSVNAPETHKQIQHEPEEKYICPTFKELFSDQNARPGENVKFECMVLGKPTPKIKWLFNDQPVQGKNFLVSTSGDRQVLIIPAASAETVGKIACIAENETGKATCVAHLNLIGERIQTPISSIDIQNVSQEHNTESSRVTIKKQTLITSSTSQIDSVQTETPQAKTLNISSTSDQSFEQIHKPTPQIIKVDIQDQKSSDSTTQPQQHEIPMKSTRKHIAPRFMNPLVGKIVDQGANVVLEAVYDGFPSPEIKVQKNGEDLFDSDRVKITNKFNKVLIDLSNIGVRDAGRYSIIATNLAGTSTSTADIIVKKTIFPPVFGHRLQAQVAKRGERVVMEVEVTGTPVPQVTWYKDNKPIKDALVSEFRIKNEGNTHTLIIEKVKTQDSGKFMVKAVNDGGESQSIADFAVLEPTPERMIEVLKTTVYDDLKDFKEEKFKPAEKSFYTKETESKNETDSHSTTESKIVTEHRCVTEATMRLEHKTNYIDLPVLTTPVIKQNLQNTKVQQGFMSTISDIPQIVPSIPSESNSIETTSISKKSAFDYFKKIENEPSVTQPEMKYTKFDESKKPEPVPIPESIHQESSQYSSSKTFSEKVTNIEDLSQFNLRPGTPPEICYIPEKKPELPSQMQISQKIKRIEESQKKNSEPPACGVSIFPQISQQEQISKSSFIKETSLETNSTLAYKPHTNLHTPQPAFERAQSPKPSAEGVAMEKLWASPKPSETSFKSIFQSTEADYTKYVPPTTTTTPQTEMTGTEEPQRVQSIKETKEIFEKKIIEQRPQSWVSSATSATSSTELKSPNLVKQSHPKFESPKPILTPTIDVQLEPGTPPEICFAPAPVKEQSVPVSIERPVSPVKQQTTVPSPVYSRTSQITESNTILKSNVFEKKFESLSYQAPHIEEQKPKPPPPAAPSKFIKREFDGSGHESEKLKFSGNESDEPVFRSVKPPQFTAKHTTEPTSIPPPQFFERPQNEESFKQSFSSEETTDHQYKSFSVKESKHFFESKQTKQPPAVPAKPSFLKQVSPIISHPQVFEKDYKTSTLSKNISMTTKQIKVNEEPAIIVNQKIPPPSSPSKFVKGEFHESDHSSDYDEKIRPIWKPYCDSDSEIKGYRPVRPSLTPTGRLSNLSDASKSPVAPSEFDHIPRFDGPPRPKFEPVKKEEPMKTHPQPQVFKPKPVSAKPTSFQPSYTTRYYTAVAGAPFHHASVATETKNTMQMKESSETCHRVVNMSQTKRVIHFDNHKSNHEQYVESFPYSPTPTNTSSPKPRIRPPSTPTKFIPGEFRESDYESEIENARIRPVWTPNPSETDEPRYRHVNPPRPTRATSLPRSYERVISPLEFDHNPPEISSRSSVYSSHHSKATDNYYTHESRATRDDMNLKVGSPPKYGYVPTKMHNQAKDLGSAFRKKTNQFINDVSKDLKTGPIVYRPGFKRAPSEGSNQPQVYRDESRISQYGTKHIDPNTGLIYFKYDFGYEFGIIFPGEGKKFIGGSSHSPIDKNSNATQKRYPNISGYSGDLIIPVQHERTTTPSSFRSYNGFNTSESEFSETESDSHTRKRYSMPIEIKIDEFHKDDRNRFYPQSTADDTGTYVCVGTNELGSASTSAELVVPTNKCGVRR